MLSEKLIFYVLKLRIYSSKISSLWYFIMVVEFLFTILLLMMKQLDDVLIKTSRPISDFFDNLYHNSIIQYYNLSAFIILSLVMVLASIFIYLKKGYNEFDNNQKIENKLSITTLILVLVFEFLLLGEIVSLKIIFIKLFRGDLQNKIQIICFLPILIIGIILQLLMNRKVRFLGFFLFLAPLLFSGFMEDNTNNIYNNILKIVSYVLVELAVIFEIYTDTDQQLEMPSQGKKLRKVLHWQLFVILAWKFCWTIDPDLQVQTINLINLLLLYLLTTILVFLKGNSKSTKLKQLFKLCEYISKMEKETLNETQKFEMKNIASLILQTDQDAEEERSLKLDLKNSRQIFQWEARDWIEFVNCTADRQMIQGDSLDVGLTLLEMKMITGEKMIEILTLFETLIKKHYFEGLMNKYKLMKIAMKIQSSHYFKREDEVSFVRVLLEVNTLRDKFYADFTRITKLYAQFWEVLAIKKINNSVQKLQFILQAFNDLRTVIRQAQVFAAFGKQKQLLSYLSQLIFHDNYIEVVREEKKDGLGYGQFIQMKQDKITLTSLKFAKELGYEKYELVDVDIKKIMLKEFSKLLLETIIKEDSTKVEIPYVLPFVCSDDSFILKNVSCYYHLDLKLGYTTILYLSKNIGNKMPAILYQKDSNLILGFNNKFADSFSVDRQKFKKDIEKGILNLEELFKDLDLSEHKEQGEATEKMSYSCMMYLKRYRSEQNIYPETLKVKVTLEESYKDFYLLKIIHGERRKSLILAMKTYDNDELDICEQDPLDSAERSQNQILCTIENPYKHRIWDIKDKLKQHRTLTYPCFISVFMTILILLIASLYIISSQKQITDRRQYSSSINQKLQIYREMKQLYESYAIFYEKQLFILAEKKSLLTDINIDKIVQELNGELKQSLNIFEQIYINMNSIDYSVKVSGSIILPLKFKEFELEINSDLEHLIDYAQKLLVNDDEDSKIFLFKNYNTFRRIWKHLIQNQPNFSSISSIQSKKAELIIFLSTSTILCFLIILLFLLIKMQRLALDIEKILFLIADYSLEDNRTTIQRVAKLEREGKLTTQKQTITQENEMNEIDNEKSLQVSYKRSEKKNPLAELEELSIDNPNNQLQETKLSGDKFDPDNEKVINSKPTTRAYCIFYYYIVFFLLVLSGSTFACLQIIQTPTTIMSQYHQIFSFMTKEKIIWIDFLQSYINIMHMYLSKDKLGTAEHFPIKEEKDTINSFGLPDSKISYTDGYIKRVTGNLCELKFQNQNIDGFGVPKQLCEQVLGGILKMGVSKTEIMLRDIMQQFHMKGISYAFKNVYLENYPIILEINFILDLLNNMFEQNQKLFQDWRIQYENEKTPRVFIIIIAIGLFIMLGMVLVVIIVKQIRKKSQSTSGIILIVSNQALMSWKILKYIRDTRILERSKFI